MWASLPEADRLGVETGVKIGSFVAKLDMAMICLFPGKYVEIPIWPTRLLISSLSNVVPNWEGRVDRMHPSPLRARSTEAITLACILSANHRARHSASR